MFLLLTYYLQGILGFSPVQAGLAFLPFMAGVVVAANFVSNMGLARLGPKVVVPVGMVLAAGGGRLADPDRGPRQLRYTVAPALVIIGLGVACAVVTAFSLGPAGPVPPTPAWPPPW